jgi:hypothetical protein
MWDFFIIFVFMNYWVNSNSGDYIVEDGGQYRLYLLARWVENQSGMNEFQKSEVVELTQSQFNSIKGFVPIKEKKLFSRLNTWNPGKRYAPTLSDGTKGKSTRVDIPTVQDIREQRLKDLGL